MSKSNEINSYKDLEVWQISMQLCKQVYRLTEQLPKSEKYGFSSQIQRCSVSVPSNIAEGSRRSTQDFRRFLKMALGSASELETQLLLIDDIYGIDVDDQLDQLEIIHKMLVTFIYKLEDK